MCKRVYILVIIVIVFSALLSTAQAGIQASVLQAYVSEQKITVFINSELRANTLKCVISSQEADIVATGALTEPNALTRTTLLLDVSGSMPTAARTTVIKTLKKFIDEKSSNEQLKLVVFGNELSVLSDFSSQDDELSVAVEKIEFNEDQSKIYDAIYNTIPPEFVSDASPVFYRTIVITDGVDDTVNGMTREELFIKLQNENYPVDVVAVSDSASAENKDLSAIVRMSKGRYCSLFPNSDTNALVHDLSTREYYYFIARIPPALLDGTVRQVDFNDGTIKNSIDIKIPAFGMAASKLSIASTSKTQDDEKHANPPNTVAFGSKAFMGVVGVGVVLIIAMSVIALIIIKGRKNKKDATSAGSETVQDDVNSYKGARTEFVSESSYEGAIFTIKLSDYNNPGQTWTLPVVGELLIGRAEHCNVRIDEQSVSREQCKIAAQDVGLVVAHLGSTNKTTLNDRNVFGSAPLQSGDILRFGRGALRVDYIQFSGSPSPIAEPIRRHSGGRTESIF